MDLNDYQESCKETAIYPGQNSSVGLGLIYTALGLAGEAGEVANKVKKILRDNNGNMDAFYRDLIIDELGDAQWYIAMIADELGVSLDIVAQKNLDKLSGRKERGTLQGSGDR